MQTNDDRGTKMIGRAEKALNDQLGGCQVEYGLSLSQIWREVGSAPGETPVEWAKRAAPLILGYAEYERSIDPEWTDLGDSDPFSSIPPESIDAMTRGILQGWYGEDCGPDGWEYGDIATHHQPIALAYALYLDQQAPAKVFG